MNQYAKRNLMDLDTQGGHYSRHVSAMTVEKLSDKSAIAGELAWRDACIEALWESVRQLRDVAMNMEHFNDDADLAEAEAALENLEDRLDRVGLLGRLDQEDDKESTP